jgi:hypothetical protein
LIFEIQILRLSPFSEVPLGLANKANNFLDGARSVLQCVLRQQGHRQDIPALRDSGNRDGLDSDCRFGLGVLAL